MKAFLQQPSFKVCNYYMSSNVTPVSFLSLRRNTCIPHSYCCWSTVKLINSFHMEFNTWGVWTNLNWTDVGWLFDANHGYSCAPKKIKQEMIIKGELWRSQPCRGSAAIFSSSPGRPAEVGSISCKQLQWFFNFVMPSGGQIMPCSFELAQQLSNRFNERRLFWSPRT